MKVKVDNNINGETPALQDTTSKKPATVEMLKVELVAAEDLPEQFKNRENDRYQITVSLEGDELKWMPNKTALKTIIATYGDESDLWIGKKIGIFLADQNVSGEMKKVAYAVAPAQPNKEPAAV